MRKGFVCGIILSGNIGAMRKADMTTILTMEERRVVKNLKNG